MDFPPRWTAPCGAGLAAMLVVTGLAAGASVRSSIAQSTACSESALAFYTHQPHATEKGARRRCSLLQAIERDGTLSSRPLRAQILKELSNRFAIQLTFKGAVGLPRQTVDYLMKNMPEAAALVSAYSDKEYMATQADGTPGPKQFFVTNGDNFAAGFTYLFSHASPQASEYMFFETGRARVMFWKIWGNSIVRYHLRNDGEKDASRYDITVHVFTDSLVLRTVLGSGLFQYFSRMMFEGILDDIETAVRKFAADADPGRHLPPYFVAGLRKSLQGGADGFEYRASPGKDAPGPGRSAL